VECTNPLVTLIAFYYFNVCLGGDFTLAKTTTMLVVQEKKKKDVPKVAEAGLIMSVDELKQKLEILEEEKKKEEELRNYMQLERVSCACIFFPILLLVLAGMKVTCHIGVRCPFIFYEGYI
jgi:hypothetical protein